MRQKENVTYFWVNCVYSLVDPITEFRKACRPIVYRLI